MDNIEEVIDQLTLQKEVKVKEIQNAVEKVPIHQPSSLTFFFVSATKGFKTSWKNA